MLENKRFFVSDGEFTSEDADKYLRSFFPDYEYKGVFVDVGAFHSQWLSNSYHFEKNGWDVICVEPNPYCYEELKSNRKRVLPYAAYVENVDNMDFCIDEMGKGPGHMAGATSLHVHYHEHKKLKEVVKVHARTLNFILEEQKVDKIDILSIDVEGGELDVLNGMNFEKYIPQIIVIENTSNKNAQNNFLENYGYKKVKRIVFNDFYVKA